MKKTKINAAHYALKAKMVEFAGWDMPVQYAGLNTEHMAVRTTGGMFDVSHMGEILFRGKEALAAVQYLTSNDAARLVPGKIQYSALLTENGCFVDDLLVYMMAENEYLLVVNAANIDKDFAWMKKQAAGFAVQIENLCGRLFPDRRSGAGGRRTGCRNSPTPTCPPWPTTTSAMARVRDWRAIISRTGYTGEDGFEIYFRSDAAAASKFFLALAEKGEKYDALPAGLGARDTLRLEAKMALYGNDIDDQHTVLEADLGWILKLKKEPFIGREALAGRKQEGIRRKLVGFEMVDRGIARHGYPVYAQGQGVWSRDAAARSRPS